MKAVVQRVRNASVSVSRSAGPSESPSDSSAVAAETGQKSTGLSLQTAEDVRITEIATINHGLLTLLGIETSDRETDIERMIKKIVNLRIFEDASGKMNLSLREVGGSHLIVSQFTLCADTSKGNRPSFMAAARPEVARPLYEHAINVSRALGVPTATGQFQASMIVGLENDGPVTLILE